MRSMKTTSYIDSRGLDGSAPAFSQVVVRGIAPGGGLYVPESLPAFTLPEIVAFAEWPYWRRAAAVFERFGVDFCADHAEGLMQTAY